MVGEIYALWCRFSQPSEVQHYIISHFFSDSFSLKLMKVYFCVNVVTCVIEDFKNSKTEAYHPI